MKRFILAMVLFFASTAVVVADERPIKIGQMPKAAISFLNKNFAGIEVLYANVERDILDTDYEVGLSDGTKIDFNGSGEWTDVSNKKSGVSNMLLPHKVAAYIEQNYANVQIIKIERSSRKYEVKLTNGLELLFTPDGELIGFDD
ncbi:MAG: PepSY-like domain-containing protein [Alistipes sp.]|nr:PepSY-like domain-containing protein [Alistipes sp.]